MKLIEKIRVSYHLFRSFVAEEKGNYELALAWSERSFQRGPSTPFFKARYAKLLMLNRRGREAEPIFHELGAAAPSTDPNEEYVRVYSGMISAFLKPDLFEADRLFADLHKINCRSGRRVHLPWSDPPSAVHARSILKELELGNADPLGFLAEKSGLHVLNAFEAWLERDFSRSLAALSEAERLGPLTPQQSALKAGQLIYLDRRDEADEVFREILADLPTITSEDEAYLRFYCEYHRPSENSNRTAALVAARELEPKVAIARILPMPDDADMILSEEAIREHFGKESWTLPVQRVQYFLRTHGDAP